MRLRSLLFVGVAAFGAVVFQTSIGAQAPASVLAGIYTSAQAERGAKVFSENCAPCHGDKLEGADPIPPLAGADFVSHWKNVGEIFDKISNTMPQMAPASLKPEEYADVLAFVLSQNKFPAGATELAPKMDALTAIKVEPVK